MNYSTIKKVVALSLLCIIGVTAANAQSASTSSAAKVFGGRAQYRTWSLGINAGVLAPVLLIGGSNDYRYWDATLGYGFTVRKQLTHVFGVQLQALRGKVSGNNNSGDTPKEKIGDASYITATNRTSFETHLDQSLALNGYVNLGTINFLNRENSLSFNAKAGMGVAWYAPTIVLANNTAIDWKGRAGDDGNNKYIKELMLPLGGGLKFKISDRANFDLGYTMFFLDGDNFDLTYAKATTKDHFSYTSAGIEFSLGNTSKPNLDWVNPVAMMYDELKDPTLRQELEALKGRVSTLENTVNTLTGDADGDGVANRFDKCPGTPAGTQVTGSGCPINFPAPPPVVQQNNITPPPVSAPSNLPIQFDFDSAVLKTSAYPILDSHTAWMKANPNVAVELDGFASSEGTEAYNMKLSADRAESVKTYLVNSGIAASRITTRSFGESNPVASNATEEGRVLNRRVEIKR